MTFRTTAALRSHYADLHARLLSIKLPWHRPEVRLIGWLPSVGEIPIPPVKGLCAPPSVHRIIGHVLIEYNVTWEELLSRTQVSRVSQARQAAFYKLLETQYSFVYIGNLFHRDHSTVIHGAKQHTKLHNLTYPRAKIPRTGRNPYRGAGGRFASGSSV